MGAFRLERDYGAGVRDRRVVDAAAETRHGIVHELHLVRDRRARLQRVKQHGDRVLATNRVAVLPLVRGEARGVLRLDERHALVVELLDRGVDLVTAIAEGREAEAPPPMAEVGRDHEEILGVGEVLGEERPIDRLVGL